MALNQIKLIYSKFIEPINKKQTQSPSHQMVSNLMIKFESFFVSVQSLLIWEKPYLSSIAFIAFNCLFWAIVCLSRRFYSLVAIILFSINFYKLWSEYIWPEIRVPPKESSDTEGWTPLHPQVLSAPEINHYLNEFSVMVNASVRWLINLRKTHRGLFCLLTSAFFFMTAIIGKFIPGVLIVYSLMMTLALGPGIVLYVLPDGFFDIIRSFLNQKPKTDETGDEKISEDSLDQPLAPQLNSGEFELNPFRNDSSLQLLSDSQLETTLDKELGIEAQLNNDEEHSARSDSSSLGIHFVSTHFSRNSSSDNIEDEFELISDTEILDTAKGSSHARQTSV